MAHKKDANDVAYILGRILSVMEVIHDLAATEYMLPLHVRYQVDLEESTAIVFGFMVPLIEYESEDMCELYNGEREKALNRRLKKLLSLVDESEYPRHLTDEMKVYFWRGYDHENSDREFEEKRRKEEKENE